jgi:hypothetical protein
MRSTQESVGAKVVHSWVTLGALIDQEQDQWVGYDDFVEQTQRAGVELSYAGMTQEELDSSIRIAKADVLQQVMVNDHGVSGVTAMVMAELMSYMASPQGIAEMGAFAVAGPIAEMMIGMAGMGRGINAARLTQKQLENIGMAKKLSAVGKKRESINLLQPSHLLRDGTSGIAWAAKHAMGAATTPMGKMGNTITGFASAPLGSLLSSEIHDKSVVLDEYGQADFALDMVMAGAAGAVFDAGAWGLRKMADKRMVDAVYAEIDDPELAKRVMNDLRANTTYARVNDHYRALFSEKVAAGGAMDESIDEIAESFEAAEALYREIPRMSAENEGWVKELRKQQAQEGAPEVRVRDAEVDESPVLRGVRFHEIPKKFPNYQAPEYRGYELQFRSELEGMGFKIGVGDENALEQVAKGFGDRGIHIGPKGKEALRKWGDEIVERVNERIRPYAPDKILGPEVERARRIRSMDIFDAPRFIRYYADGIKYDGRKMRSLASKSSQKDFPEFAAAEISLEIKDMATGLFFRSVDPTSPPPKSKHTRSAKKKERSAKWHQREARKTLKRYGFSDKDIDEIGQRVLDKIYEEAVKAARKSKVKARAHKTKDGLIPVKRLVIDGRTMNMFDDLAPAPPTFSKRYDLGSVSMSDEVLSTRLSSLLGDLIEEPRIPRKNAKVPNVKTPKRLDAAVEGGRAAKVSDSESQINKKEAVKAFRDAFESGKIDESGVKRGEDKLRKLEESEVTFKECNSG